MQNENIKRIFENTINDFLIGFNADDKDKIKNLYFSYLTRKYSKINLNDISIKYYSDLEKIKWKDLSLEGKLSVISEDKNLDEIIKLSMEGLKAADDFRMNGNKFDKKTANEKIQRMNDLFDKVLEFNKGLARYYCSEGSLDFSYAAGMSDLMSLRTGRSK